MKCLRILSILAISVMVSIGSSASYAGSSHDVVTNSYGNIVKNTYGNCVRTKWNIGMDKCAPPAVATPMPVKMESHHPKTVIREHARSYLVFFDFDKSGLTPQAQNIVHDLYKSTHGAVSTHFSVTGHADRSGPDAYNMKLSQRRAEAVRAELQRLGANTQHVTVDWKGEHDPLVQTKDGIREPQNRRAQINVRVEKQEMR